MSISNLTSSFYGIRSTENTSIEVVSHILQLPLKLTPHPNENKQVVYFSAVFDAYVRLGKGLGSVRVFFDHDKTPKGYTPLWTRNRKENDPPSFLSSKIRMDCMRYTGKHHYR